MDARGEESFNYVLNLKVIKATNVDRHAKFEGLYCVIVSDGHRNRNEKWTCFAGKYRDENGRRHNYISWNCDIKMQFSYFPIDEFLYVEVIKVQAEGGDPGTSDGATVVGRAKIPMFPIEEDEYDNQRFHQLIKVVGSKKEFAGYIHLRMELEKFKQ